VLGRVVSGLANKSIAEEMGIGEQAVKAHISRLFLKFRVENRAGLAVAAMTQALNQRSVAADELERLAREEHRDALRTRAKLLASLVGKDPAVVIDRDARVVLANPAFQRTFVAALYQDERGVKLPADATPLARAAHGKPASLRFKLASGPRKGTWWHATGERVEYRGVGAWTVLVFRRVRGPAA
jgi:PAS domain-containing protein